MVCRAVPSIALYVLPRLIRGFQQRYPKVTFELFEDTTDKLARHPGRPVPAVRWPPAAAMVRVDVVIVTLRIVSQSSARFADRAGGPLSAALAPLYGTRPGTA